MRRILSVLLAFLLTASVLFASVPTAVAQSAGNNVVAAETLKAFGAIAEYDKNTDWNQVIVTRGELLSMLVRLGGFTDSYNVKSLRFSDINLGHTYYKEICYAQNHGFIDANGGKFEPDATADFEFATELALNVLGYKDILKYIDGKYRNLGAYKEVVKGVTNSALTLNDAYTMCFNALTAPMAEVNTISEQYSKYEYSGDYTLAYKHFDAQLVEGKFVSTEFASFDGVYTSSGFIKIDDFICKADTRFFDLFGYNVCAFVKTDASHEIIWMYADDNEVTVLNPEDFGSFSKNNLVYFENNRKKVLKLNTPIIVYNGQNISGAEYSNEIFNISDGNITIIEDSEYGDLISITSYKNMIIGSVDFDKNIICAQNLAGVTLDIPDDIGTVFEIYNYSMELMDKEQLKKGMLLTYASSMNQKLIRCYVSQNVVESTVDGISKKDDINEYVWIDEVKYKVSQDVLKQKEKLELGSSYEFYINCFGTIGAIALTSSDNEKSCYILASYTDDFSDEFKLKVILSTALGEDDAVVYDVNPKVRIDGKKYDSISNAEKAIFSFNPGGYLPARIRTNKAGVINYIDTPTFNSDKEQDDTLRQIKKEISYTPGGWHYSATNEPIYSLGHKYFVLPTTMVVMQPTDLSEIIIATRLANSSLSMDLYSLGTQTPALAFAVVHDNASTSPIYLDGMYIVKRISKVLDDEEELAFSVTLINESLNEVKYLMDINKASVVEETAPGDIVRVATDSRNRITALNTIAKYDNIDEYMVDKSGVDLNAEKRYVVGYVYSVYSTNTGGKDIIKYFFDEEDIEGTSEAYLCNSDSCYLIEANGRDDLKISSINVDELRTYENYGQDADVMLFTYSYHRPGNKYVIRQSN